MSYEIVSQVEELFKDKEQWDNFLDIANQRNIIRDTWWKKFQLKMNKSVSSINSWGYSSDNHFNYYWYITEFGINSFCLRTLNYYNKMILGLWAPQNKYNIKTLSELLQKEEYGEPIKAKFDRLIFVGNETNEWKYFEYIVPDDVKEIDSFDIDRMAWYANNKTDELVSLFINKVNKFREDEEITKILIKLNNETIIK